MKKILMAALAAGTLALGACSAPDAEVKASLPATGTAAPTADRVLETTTFVAPAAKPSAGLGSEQRREIAFYEVLAEEGIVVDDDTAYMAGLATCQFLDEGGDMADLALGLALSEEDAFDTGISNDDMPFLMGAAIGAFCPEHAGVLQ